ncbi:MAG TPA: AmmeMemoRadiSam system protein A [Acidimicrobiia bacterium]|nr:AmmeMemoRadiSam system protein A [Acidimicrobiia bacterium]
MSEPPRAESWSGLDTQLRATVLEVAEETLAVALTSGRAQLPSPDEIRDARLWEPAATFVTLERGTQLLGCIGTLEAREPLAVSVARHALGAAFADPRVPPITHLDYVMMSIKVSVLSEPNLLAAESTREVSDAVRPGVDGLVLDAPGHHSTLLPSVWRHLPDVDGFLDALWAKAGLPRDVWLPGTRVLRYTTDEFGSPGPRAPASSAVSGARVPRSLGGGRAAVPQGPLPGHGRVLRPVPASVPGVAARRPASPRPRPG